MLKNSAERKELLDKLKGVGLDTSDSVMPVLRYLSTGFNTFDKTILGCPGLPYGRVIQLYGPEGSGKTLLALRAIARAQQDNPGKFVAYVDTEYTFDPDWAVRQGVNLPMLRLVQSNVAEEALGKAIKFAMSGACSAVVIDSIGNLLQSDGFDISEYYKQNKKGDFEHREQPGVIPKKVTMFIRQMAKYVYDNQVLFICVNQVRDRIGVLHGDPTDTPGGKALKHNLTLNIGLGKVEDLIDSKTKEVNGVKIRARVKKSKLASSKVTDESNHLMFYFDNGIAKSVVVELYDRAVNADVIIKSGAWFTWNVDNSDEPRRWQGRDNVLADLLNDPDLRKKLEKDVSVAGSKKPIHVELVDEQESIELLS